MFCSGYSDEVTLVARQGGPTSFRNQSGKIEDCPHISAQITLSGYVGNDERAQRDFETCLQELRTCFNEWIKRSAMP